MAEDVEDQKENYAIVGELVLISNALDHQFGAALIEVMGLERTPMLGPVVYTLDPSRKIEMLKGRAKFIGQADWKSALKKYTSNAEAVFKKRNLACHMPASFKNGKWTLMPSAASKIFANLDLKHEKLNHISFDDLKEAIPIAQAPLGEGAYLIQKFAELRAVLKEREKAPK